MDLRIESALSYVSPMERETWISMGMAIKSDLGDAGFDLWDRWSQQAGSYRERDAKVAWRSFRNGKGITIRSLFHAAKEAGWRDQEGAQNAPQRSQPAKTVDDTKAIEIARQKAANRAAWIIKQTRQDFHPYLGKKGFPEAIGLVWEKPGEYLLVIPMYVGKLVNVQTVTPEGEKKFLAGGQAGGAEHILGNGGIDVLVEGYATGLSALQAMQALRKRARVHVTFSANNMKRIARGLRGGLVIADNDASGTGQKAAEEIGWPYWISDRTNEDFNDFSRRIGLFKTTQSLRNVISRLN